MLAINVAFFDGDSDRIMNTWIFPSADFED
jgi:hypothetical protein